MHLKPSLLALLTSAACLTAPAVFAQEPPTESPPPPDWNDPSLSSDSSEDMDQGAAAAQEDPAATTSPAAPSSSSAAVLDDKKIEQFADAYMQVQSIQQKAASDLQTAQDPASADQVKTAAESEMIAAVERSGLKIEEFNQIVESMASNVEVRNRVAAKIQEKSGG